MLFEGVPDIHAVAFVRYVEAKRRMRKLRDGIPYQICRKLVFKNDFTFDPNKPVAGFLKNLGNAEDDN